jgi:hypothetical protein
VQRQSICVCLYVNEFIEMLSNHNQNVISVNDDVTYICQLLFADDMANMSDMVVGLQGQVHILYDFSVKYCMRVNIEKILVFRRGGGLCRRDVLSLNGMVIGVVTYYKYLGLLFSCFCHGEAKRTLSQQADKAMNMLLAFISKSRIDHKKALFLFDRMIVQFLTYGSEMWGCDYAAPIEKVYTNSANRF